MLHRGRRGPLLIFDRTASDASSREWRGHRAIGVVYQPEYEQYGNYVPTVLPRRYDAFLFIDETKAVRPLLPPTVELEARRKCPRRSRRGCDKVGGTLRVPWQAVGTRSVPPTLRPGFATCVGRDSSRPSEG